MPVDFRVMIRPMMLRRLTIVIIVVCAVAAVAFFMHRPVSPGPAGHLQFNPITSAAWPANQTYTWSFQLPDDIGDREGLSLQTRRKSKALRVGEDPSYYGQTAAMAAGEAQGEECSAGIIVLSKTDSQPQSGNVTVQFLDLSDIGAVSSKPDANLRVLCTLSVGMARSGPGGDHIFLPPGQFGNFCTQNQGVWSNNELYLMSYYVQSGQTLWQYDVFLSHRRLPAASSATQAAADAR